MSGTEITVPITLFSVIIENMLEKNENILYFDAHFHLADCMYDNIPLPGNDMAWYACACSHSKEEWEITERFTALRQAQGPRGPQMYLSYGLHPQSAGHIDVKENADFLEQLLHQHKLNAIGEAGFDYFNEEFRAQAATQEEMFNLQLDLALKYNRPLVIHCRKANEKLFEYSKQLKKLPGVLFHSFMGMPNEAKSLLSRGINGYFSFGKQMMNNNKKVIACVKELPLNVILAETDAPFQYLKNERFTHPNEIKKIYDAISEIRGEELPKIQETLAQNFMNLFSLN